MKSAALIAFAFLLGLGLTLFLVSPGSSAGAQEATFEETIMAEETESEISGQLKPIPERGQRAAEQSAAPEAPGPLAGEETLTTDRNRDGFTDLITVAGDCKVKQGASFVLQDDDGTQGSFVDNDNVQIVDRDEEIRIVSNFTAPDNRLVATGVRGGDGTLDGGGLTVATTTGITCEDDGEGGETPPEETTDNPGENTNEETTGGENGNGNGNEELPEEEQDDVEGPLAGGTAYGFDEIVPEDIIRTLPDGTVVYGLDRIRIYTENCDITESEDLSFTLEESAGLFRVRDRDNVNITLEEDGTFVIDGREEVRGRDNPDQVIIPIPVDPENYESDNVLEDTFPIVSSTGVGGEGCKAVLAETTTSENTNSNNGSSNDGDRESSVIQGTYDANKTLANTGGATVGLVGLNTVSAVLIPSGALLVVFGVGAGLWLRRNGLAGRE